MNEATALILGLQEQVIESVEEGPEGFVLGLVCEVPTACPHCGRHGLHGHGGLPQRTAAHLWIGEKALHLRWTPHRWRCPACRRTTTSRPPGLQRWQRLTDQARALALQALKYQSFNRVAQSLGIGVGTLRRLVDRHVPWQRDDWWDLEGPLVLSLDEHSFRGQDLVITIALQSPERRLLAILTDDQIKTLDRWFVSVPQSVRNRIIAATIDLKASYRRALERWCPNAKVIVDPFHVVHDANVRIDKLRLLEQAETKTRIPRWPLLKGQENLTRRQREQLGNIQKQFPDLAALHRLKEDLRLLLASTDPVEATHRLHRWLINARACDHAEGNVWANTIRRWKPQILALFSFTRRYTNGYIEGVHTKIKQLKRLSFGFYNRDRYRRKMMLSFIPTTAIPQLLT